MSIYLNKLILFTIALNAIILSVNVKQCVSLSPYLSGMIKEEDYIVNKPNKRKTESGNLKKIKKEYSTKEVVFGQDDDEDDDDSDEDQGKNINSVNVVENKLNNNNKNNNNNIKINNQPSIDLFDRLQRNQRFENFNHESKIFDRLKTSHRNNKQLDYIYLKQKQEQQEKNDLKLLDELLKKNSDLFEEEMKLAELSSSIGSNRFEDFDQENMLEQLLLNQQKNHNNHKNNKNNYKPVKNVDVEEKLLLEKDYNKQFIHDPKDPNLFFSAINAQDFIKNIYDVKNEEKQQDRMESFSNAINSPPSMIEKQTYPTFDPHLNSEISKIRKQNDYLFIFVIAGCTIAGVVALIAAGVCWYTVYRHTREVEEDVKNKSNKFNASSISANTSGDRRLAQSAQMYHYQHQKQQMIAMEKANNDAKPDNSDNSDGETEEGDYTVYECPGLAPTGEMEVKNPLFKEDFTTSTSNLFLATNPPAYSTLNPSKESESIKSEKDDVQEKKDDENNLKTNKTDSVTIEISETSPNSNNN